MIIRMPNKDVFVLFGTGDIAVDNGAPEDRGPNEPTDVIFSEHEPQPIGTLTENEEVCTADLKEPVILRFSKPESVDVVISALEKVRESLERKPFEDSDGK